MIAKQSENKTRIKSEKEVNIELDSMEIEMEEIRRRIQIRKDIINQLKEE